MVSVFQLMLYKRSKRFCKNSKIIEKNVGELCDRQNRKEKSVGCNLRATHKFTVCHLSNTFTHLEGKSHSSAILGTMKVNRFLMSWVFIPFFARKLMTLLNDKVNKPLLDECVRMRSVAIVSFPLNIIHMKLKFPSSCCLK